MKIRIFSLKNEKEDLKMKKKLGLLLSAIMVLGAAMPIALAWENPLTKYNLYEDTRINGSGEERETVMSEYYMNSVGNKLNSRSNNQKSTSYTNSNDESAYPIPPSYDIEALKQQAEASIPKRRNEILRESSRNVYSDMEKTPAWEEGPSFYPNPTMESIIEKYRRSDFAGCMQECSAYVRKYPNDTLGFYYLAMCYTKVSDKDNAIKSYERVIELNDNPMIVKYATNGRNCVMGNEKEQCYMNVNVPELLRPYESLANIQLTPINPQILIDRNVNSLRSQLNTSTMPEGVPEQEAEGSGIQLPFGNQDADLDAFINAPYGNGFSPELNNQYKQLQLKKIQQTINQGKDNDSDVRQHLDTIKKFDRQKSESETIKLAYDNSGFDFESLKNDPEFVRQQQEIDELNMMFGNNATSSDGNDITDLIPYMSGENKNISPEVVQTLMMKSVLGNISL